MQPVCWRLLNDLFGIRRAAFRSRPRSFAHSTASRQMAKAFVISSCSSVPFIGSNIKSLTSVLSQSSGHPAYLRTRSAISRSPATARQAASLRTAASKYTAALLRCPIAAIVETLPWRFWRKHWRYAPLGGTLRNNESLSRTGGTIA